MLFGKNNKLVNVPLLKLKSRKLLQHKKRSKTVWQLKLLKHEERRP